MNYESIFRCDVIEILTRLILINSNFTLFIQFGSVAFRFTLNTLIYMYYLHCWENGVLQLVSEQVGSSGQVVESRSVV